MPKIRARTRLKRARTAVEREAGLRRGAIEMGVRDAGEEGEKRWRAGLRHVGGT